MTASNGLWCTCMNNGRLGNFSLTERVKFIRSQLCSDEINILGAISTKWGLLSNFGLHSTMAVYIWVSLSLWKQSTDDFIRVISAWIWRLQTYNREPVLQNGEMEFERKVLSNCVKGNVWLGVFPDHFRLDCSSLTCLLWVSQCSNVEGVS